MKSLLYSSRFGSCGDIEKDYFVKMTIVITTSALIFVYLNECPELLIRQEKGLLSRDALLLAIDDPKPNIGSGSATLNALLCVAEHMAAKERLTVRELVCGDHSFLLVVLLIVPIVVLRTRNW